MTYVMQGQGSVADDTRDTGPESVADDIPATLCCILWYIKRS